MSIENIRKINNAWGKKLMEDEYDKSFWNYEPFSDDYWNENHKIVFCNLESVGGGDKEDHLFSKSIFEENLRKGYRTLKFTSLFSYCLYKKLNQQFTFSEKELKKLYYKNEELLTIMEKITYMNLRKEESWSDNKNLQKDELYRFLDPNRAAREEDDEHEKIDWEYTNKPHRDFTLQFINELKPNIFIVSGEVGYDILNKLYEDKIQLRLNETYRYNNILFASVYHPRVFSYQYILDRTDQIINDYNKGVSK